jgi:putative methyltransferase (TIGR04325 family)
MKETIKLLVARLPWGVRKLASFVALHGPFSLLMSRPHFIGAYPSFDKVPIKRAPDNQIFVRAGRVNVSRLKCDLASDLPILDHSHSLLPLTVAMLASRKPLRILDFGGASGTDFRNLLRAIPDNLELRYHVIDLPEVCADGRSRWKEEKRISFSEEMPDDGEHFDLVYSSWAVFYVREPLSLLKRFASYGWSAILLLNVPFTRQAAFVRIQCIHMLPSWVLSLSDVRSLMRERGYDLAFHVAREVDHNVDNYPVELRVPNFANLLFLKS